MRLLPNSSTLWKRCSGSTAMVFWITASSSSGRCALSAWWRRSALQVLVQDSHGIIAQVGRSASEYLIHHDSQTIDVRTDIYRTILYLFWCHIHGCTEQGTGPSQTGSHITHCRGESKIN